MSITIRRAGPEDAAALRGSSRHAPCPGGHLQLPSPPLQRWGQKLTRGMASTACWRVGGEVAGALVLMVEPAPVAATWRASAWRYTMTGPGAGWAPP